MRVSRAAVFLFLLLSTGHVFAQGVIFPGAGALNRSMGGVSTAIAVDAAGANYWNPATLSLFEQGEVFVGGDFMYADTFLDSAVAGSGNFGSNRSFSGLASAPVIGIASRPRNASLTYGIGIYSLVGRNISFPVSEFNPVLRAYNPPESFGLGPVSASFSGFQFSPSVAADVGEKLTVAGGITVSSLNVTLDPALFAGRNTDGTFSTAIQGRPSWGLGFQVGILYRTNELWDVGASFKSKQRFEQTKYNSSGTNGQARDLFLDIDFPMILSFGVSYKGMESTKIAADIRYFDYKNTNLFGDEPLDGSLGWQNVWAFAVGSQTRINDTMKFQAGFTFNGNPIPEAATLFNIQFPALNKYAIATGLTVALTDVVDLTGSVYFAPRTTNTGSILEVPGTAVQIRQDLTTFSLGLTFRF